MSESFRRGPARRERAPSIRGDPDLGERLALIDALRMGDARIRNLAAELLSQRLAQATRALSSASLTRSARRKLTGRINV